jgi:hypothetical protein
LPALANYIAALEGQCMRLTEEQTYSFAFNDSIADRIKFTI